MGKHAIVFGGAGFIGSHLLSQLSSCREYDQLVCADIGTPRFSVPGVEYVHVDVRKPIPDTLCLNAIEGSPNATEIYNLAAVHATPGHEDWEYFWTNVLGATHISDFARRNHVETILFTSSIAVYGATEDALDEEAIPTPNTSYGRSKLSAEKIHHLWQSEQPSQRKLVIVRPAVIYGNSERGNFTRLADMLRRNRFIYPGRTDTIKSCGYVKDLIRSMQFMLDRPEHSITYNFCHAERYTMQEICSSFSRVAGFREPRFVFPLAPMLVGGWLFEFFGRLGLKSSINRARIWKLVLSTNIIPGRLTEFRFPYAYNLDQSLADWMKDAGKEFL